MASPAPAYDARGLEAGQIVATVLRFQEPLARPMSKHTSEGMPVVGVDSYVFLPSPRPVRRSQLAAHLASLPCPALLAPTTARGVVGLILLDELSGERRAAMQHELGNQSALLAEWAPGSDTDRVLIEFDDESHQFSLAAVRLFARHYGILVGWNVGACGDAGGAEWRMNLFGGDGERCSRGVGQPPPAQ